MTYISNIPVTEKTIDTRNDNIQDNDNVKDNDNEDNDVEMVKYKDIHTADIRNAILNNKPIDDILYIIIVISNPCQYKSRYVLANEFIERMKNEKYIKLFIVELTYNNQPFVITNKDNKSHLQLNCSNPLWHKENMINIGVKKLLPSNWKAFAWIDADIEFENPNWALDTLKILNGTCDIVQLFSHAIDMNKNEDAMNIFTSFGYQYIKKRMYTKINVNKMWHPGYAWACTRDAYTQMNGLYEYSIVGSGDNNIALSLIGLFYLSINKNSSNDYKKSLYYYQLKISNLRLGYVPGVIRHYFHGNKKNRQYKERWEILIKHKYSPKIHITKNNDGLLIPTEKCSQKMLSDIKDYFFQRLEDDN